MVWVLLIEDLILTKQIYEKDNEENNSDLDSVKYWAI